MKYILLLIILAACDPMDWTGSRPEQKCIKGVVHYKSSKGWWIPMRSVECVLDEDVDITRDGSE